MNASVFRFTLADASSEQGLDSDFQERTILHFMVHRTKASISQPPIHASQSPDYVAHRHQLSLGILLTFIMVPISNLEMGTAAGVGQD